MRATALFALLVLSSSPASAATTKKLSLTLYSQHTDSWCWAAAGQMIMRFLGATSLDQCQEANYMLDRIDCCGGASCTKDSDCSGSAICSSSNACVPSACVEGGSTQWTPWGFTAENRSCSNFLTFNEVKTEIDAGRPIEFSWGRPCTTSDHSGCDMSCGKWRAGGHVLVVSGYKDDGANSMVYVDDPIPVGVGSRYWLDYDYWISSSADSSGSADCASNAAGSCASHYTQSHTLKIKDNSFCYSDFYGLASGDFADCNRYHNVRDKQPATVSMMNFGGSVTVAGSYRQLSTTRKVSWLQSVSDWETTVAANSDKGYRPDMVSVAENSSGDRVITTVYAPSDGHFYYYCGLTPTDMQSYNQMYNSDHTLVDFFGYTRTTDSVYFCAVWVNKGASEYFDWDYDVTGTQLDDAVATATTYMPARVSAYDTTAGRRYAVLWKPRASDWRLGRNMTSSYFDSIADDYRNQGFVKTYVSSFDGRYTVLWTK